jgi:hypothetical protein
VNPVGKLLTDAVPELPSPLDRVAEVAARVRRTRRRTGGVTVGLVAVAVALAVAVPQLLTDAGPQRYTDLPRPAGPVLVGADSCPGPGTDFGPSDVDSPGPLVPTGAVEVALCELPVNDMPGQPPVAQEPPRVLRTGVAEHVALLNSLPDKERYIELIRDKYGQPDAQLGCTLIGYPTEISLRLRYPDRDPVFVLLDRNCSTARVEQRVRYWWTDPLADFFDRYRKELGQTTDPRTVKRPDCGQTITADRLRMERYPSGPVDGIGRNRYGTPTMLPNTLLGAVICRYTVANSTAGLTATKSLDSDLPGLRDTLNKQFERDANGPVQPLVECGMPGDPAPTRLDTILVVDTTGAASEFWIVRAPCAAVITAGMAGITPTPAVLRVLDQ